MQKFYLILSSIKKNLYYTGYNATILAYGQTGSGKTHTMGTSFNGLPNDDIGVIPRSIIEIFECISNMPEYTFEINCSFMELYQERLYDLLNEKSQSVVDIREDANREIIIPNLTEINVETAERTTELLIKGSDRRAVGSTAMNATSSRSHAIFTITLQMMKKNDVNSSTKSKFHLVDLAGSERSKKTKATGDRFKEGVKINQGLLALGNVISALGTKNGSNTNAHIGYRDSKLTRLLQDSLGGNSITLMIACISPADYNIDETISTLRYADRAKQIRNKPIVNQDPKTAEINRLNGIIQKLRLELLNSTTNVIVAAADDDNCHRSNSIYKTHSTTNNVVRNTDEENRLRQQLKASLAENQSLSKRLETTLYDAISMEHRLNEAETTNEQIVTHVLALKNKVTQLTNEKLLPDTCPAEYVLQIRNIANDIIAIDDLLRKNTEMIANNDQESLTAAGGQSRNSSIDGGAAGDDSSLVDSIHTEEDLKKKCEVFTTKQVGYRDELNDIKQQLALKQELERKLNGNFSNFCSFEENIKADGKIKDYEAIIASLEHEREALLRDVQKNKSSVISGKLAEDRRKRVQQLEQEIADVKRKNKHQAQLLKQREKDQQKIIALQSDIQEMKAKKIKLIRTMKSDSEDFRQWKLLREKEIVQLREKDRKRNAEMVKKVRLHEKQQNVLKRKVEEAVAVNKRLKDAMDKHKLAQASRMKKPIASKTAAAENISEWMEQELEILTSVIDAKQMLEQLIDERSQINLRLIKLKKLPHKSVDTKMEIEQIDENLQVRNAQILDLQEKIKSTDIDTKTKTIFDGLSSMPDAKTAMRHLFTRISDMRVDFLNKVNKINELKDAEQLWKEKETALQQQIDELTRKKNQIEQDYEDKIAVLLRELSAGGAGGNDSSTNDGKMIKTESKKIREDEIEHLHEKIERYKEEIESLKGNLVMATSRRQITQKVS